VSIYLNLLDKNLVKRRLKNCHCSPFRCWLTSPALDVNCLLSQLVVIHLFQSLVLVNFNDTGACVNVKSFKTQYLADRERTKCVIGDIEPSFNLLYNAAGQEWVRKPIC